MTGPARAPTARAAAAWIALAALATALALCAAPPREREAAPPSARGAMVVITLEGEVGSDIAAPGFELALRRALAALQDAPPGVERVALIDLFSNGGRLAEVPALVDLTTRAEFAGLRVVVRVRRAYSAAALFAIASDEIVFDGAGVMGVALATDTDPATGGPAALSPDEQSIALRVGRMCAERSGHSPQIVLAMQLPTGLSGTRGGDGSWTLANDASRPTVFAPVGSFLVLNAESASALGVSLATVDRLDNAGLERLATTLGLTGIDVLDAPEPMTGTR